MKVYIQGSGKLNGQELATLVAVCVPPDAQNHLPTLFHKLRSRLQNAIQAPQRASSEEVSIAVEAIKKGIYGSQFLQEELYNRAHNGEKTALELVGIIEEIFSQLSYSPYFDSITIFATIIPRLSFTPHYQGNLLPNQVRYLLQRIDTLLKMYYENQTAAIYFNDEFSISEDESVLQFRDRFTYSVAGDTSPDKWSHISSTPSFSKPVLEEGLQLADVIAHCLRLGWEKKLIPFYVRPTWDRANGSEPDLLTIIRSPFLRSLHSYLRVIFCRTRNIKPYYGIYALSERDFRLEPVKSGATKERSTTEE
jgi:hypothetical protein